jgi:hypothetical protein
MMDDPDSVESEPSAGYDDCPSVVVKWHAISLVFMLITPRLPQLSVGMPQEGHAESY